MTTDPTGHRPMDNDLDPATIAAELAAMEKLVDVLQPLTPMQRRRVLDWARGRFETAPYHRGGLVNELNISEGLGDAAEALRKARRARGETTP